MSEPVRRASGAPRMNRRGTRGREPRVRLRSAPAAADDPLGEWEGRDPVDGLAGEQAGLEPGNQLGELVALGGPQPARSPVGGADEHDEPAALGGGQAQDVVTGEQPDLGDREQLEDGDAAQPGNASRGAPERAGDQSVSDSASLVAVARSGRPCRGRRPITISSAGSGRENRKP